MKNTFTSLRFFPLLLILFYTNVNAASWTVTINADTGPGSLRNTIAAASIGDNIYFNAPMTITLTSTLTISKGLNIDATVGAGIGWSAGNNQVIIAGTGSVANGLQLSATGISIKGITFQNFATNCIYFSGATNFNIKSCFFNTNSTGTTANASAISQAVGMYISGASSGGIIGGPNVGDGNVFYTATTNRTCLDLYNISGMTVSTKIIVQGNKFGTDYTGTANFGLGTNCGIQCAYMNYVQIGGLGAGEGNQFEGSSGSLVGGIRCTGTGNNTNFTIQGNKIGSVAACYNGVLLNGGGTFTSFDISKNTINNSSSYAVDMSGIGASSTGISIYQNSFSNNTAGGINTTATPPTVLTATPDKITGNNASPNASINIYLWDGITSNPQGTTWVATVTANSTGVWSYFGSFILGQQVVVTGYPVSLSMGTTRFSNAVTVAPCTSFVNAGPDQTICSTTPTVSLSATPTNVTNPNWTILVGGGTLSNPNTYTPVYNLSAGEQNTSTALTVKLVISVSTTTCAPTITDTVAITIVPKPVVNAGPNQSLCANAGSGVPMNGSVANASGGIWSGGVGAFSPNANTLTATYFPSASEKVAGNAITLTLTSTAGVCTAVAGTMVINITAAPTVGTGGNQSVCSNIPSLSLSGSVTGATGGTWTTSGNGVFANPNTLNTTYSFTPTEKAGGTVTLTLTSTGNGSCSPVNNQKVITFNAAPIANAGPDQTQCIPASSVTLSGTSANSSAVQWTTTGVGTLSNATTLTPTYAPTTSESTTALTINFTLMVNGIGTCGSVTDVMAFTIKPTSVANAGSDLTMCANATNISLSGSTSSATSSVWSTSGSGSFANPSLTTAVYTPSTADRTAGSVTLTLTATGCGTVTDAMVLTITPCLTDPGLSFETPNLYKNNGDVPFKHKFTPPKSTGAITYVIATPTSCATISVDGYVTLTCVDIPLTITAYQAASQYYRADTASYTLYIGKAATIITLESRGSDLAGGPFLLKTTTNYDQTLTYSIVGGDPNAITLDTATGLITPVALGTVIIRAAATGDTNFEKSTSNDASVTIYPTLTPPVAINDTLHMFIGETKTARLADNDYGTTASINLSPMLIDIDPENPGIQSKYFRPGIGIFTVDSSGVLTFSAFQAFIGVDSLQYTITDSDNLTSKRASFVFYVTSPVAEIAMKANEIITANGDNLNNALVVGYTDLTQNNDLLIVDAAGNKLYYEKNYQNNWSATDSSGNNLGNGVYYYIFREFDAIGTVRRQLKGNFTVIR
jgi:hypothetical protein